MSDFSLESSENSWNSYLFEYGHDGALWSFEIPARNEQEARERVRNLANASYLGEIKLKLRGSSGGLFARIRSLIRGFV